MDRMEGNSVHLQRVICTVRSRSRLLPVQLPAQVRKPSTWAHFTPWPCCLRQLAAPQIGIHICTHWLHQAITSAKCVGFLLANKFLEHHYVWKLSMDTHKAEMPVPMSQAHIPSTSRTEPVNRFVKNTEVCKHKHRLF